MISRKGDVAIKCHKCGKAKSFRVGGITIAEDMHEIRIEGGHGDEFPQDLDVLAFDVCGTCLKSWVEEFEHCEEGKRCVMQQSLTALKFVLEHAPIEQCVTIQASLTDPLVDVVRSLGDVEVIDISGGARPHTIVDRMRDAIRRRARAIVVYEDKVNFDTEVHHAVFCAIVDREVGGESVDGLRMVIVHPHLLTAYDLAFLYKTIYFTSEGGVTQEVPMQKGDLVEVAV